MPRLRRSARERRLKPKLNAEVWAWLNGKPEEELSTAGRWAVYILEGPAVHAWRPPDGPPDRVDQFWDRVYEAVENGDLEVAEDVEHNFADPPLVDLEQFGGAA
jgi:hypothetical protein